MISNRSLVSNAIGACVSALIYLIIDVSTGATTGNALWRAAVFGLALFVAYFAVSLTVVRFKRRSN